MKTLVHWAKAVSAVVGAVLAAATLMGMLNEALVRHLDEVFLTKDEYRVGNAQLEQKLDTVLRRLDQPEHRKK